MSDSKFDHPSSDKSDEKSDNKLHDEADEVK